jgi:hypothetical protein
MSLNKFVVAPLKRDVSKKIVKQQFGDCYGHAITNMFLKYFKTKYTDHAFFEGLQESYDAPSLCDALYYDPTLLYDCSNGTCNLNNKGYDVGLESSCKNKSELNSLLLYAYIYRLLVDEYGCNGGPDIESNQYVISKLYNKKFIDSNVNNGLDDNSIAKCGLKNKYCKVINEILLENYNDKTNYINEKMFKFPIFNPIFSEVSPTAKQEKYSYNETKNIFFETIKSVLDKGLYINLSLYGAYYFLTFRHLKNTGEYNKTNLSSQEYDNLFIEFNKEDYKNAELHRSHIMNIVDCDYTDNNNRFITIKNSWGLVGGTGFFLIYEKDIDYLNKFHGFHNNKINNFIINLDRVMGILDNTSNIMLSYIEKKDSNPISANIVRNLAICDVDGLGKQIVGIDIKTKTGYLEEIVKYGSWISLASMFDCLQKSIADLNLVDVFKEWIFKIELYSRRYLLLVVFFEKMIEYKVPVNESNLRFFLLDDTKLFSPRHNYTKHKRNYINSYQELYHNYIEELTYTSGGKKSKRILKRSHKRKNTRKNKTKKSKK